MLGISAKAADLIESGTGACSAGHFQIVDPCRRNRRIDIVEERSEPEPIAHDMAVAREDDDVVVVDKPEAVPRTHPSDGPVRRCLAA